MSDATRIDIDDLMKGDFLYNSKEFDSATFQQWHTSKEWPTARLLDLIVKDLDGNLWETCGCFTPREGWKLRYEKKGMHEVYMWSDPMGDRRKRL